jgi:hypothetical protein
VAMHHLRRIPPYTSYSKPLQCSPDSLLSYLRLTGLAEVEGHADLIDSPTPASVTASNSTQDLPSDIQNHRLLFMVQSDAPGSFNDPGADDNDLQK